MIETFREDYFWLSNFFPVKIVLHKIEYPSVEHAYNSEKSESEDWKKFCSDKKNSAQEVKIKSKNIAKKANWKNIKIDIMRECLLQKFSQEPFKTNLLQTGSEYLQEGNMWNDTFWGFCLKTNKGKNHLGKLIMDIRSSLQDDSDGDSNNISGISIFNT